MLISALIGILGSGLPHIFEIFSKWQDNKQELAILNLQMQLQAQGHTEKMQEINANADIAETDAIYRTYNSGVKWVDAFNGTVRPVLMYAFFLLYCFVKHAQYAAYTDAHGTLPWLTVQSAIWNEWDMDLFTSAMLFYFGNRSFEKLRKM